MERLLPDGQYVFLCGVGAIDHWKGSCLMGSVSSRAGITGCGMCYPVLGDAYKNLCY